MRWLSTDLIPGADQATLSASSFSAHERTLPYRLTLLPSTSTLIRRASIPTYRQGISELVGGQRDELASRSAVRISVQDLGGGIKLEIMEHIFEAFYSTKPQGMGMGLRISLSIVEAHGGRLWAAPNAGPGAAFFFALPAES